MLPNNLNLSDFQSLHYTCRHKHRRHYLAGFSPNSWPYALANEYYPISIDPDPFWCQSSTILFQVCHQKSYYLFSDSLAQPVCHLGNDKILFHQKKWIFYCCRDNICRWFLPRKILRFRQGIFWTNCNLFLDGQFGKEMNTANILLIILLKKRFGAEFTSSTTSNRNHGLYFPKASKCNCSR